MPNRYDHRQLAETRLRDARTLLRTTRNDSGTYYIAGYVIECALKACIAKQSGVYPFPVEIKKGNYYTHSFKTLIATANLEQPLGIARQADSVFDAYCSTVESWTETSRYEVLITRQQAEDMVEAVGDPKNGLLKWLKAHW